MKEITVHVISVLVVDKIVGYCLEGLFVYCLLAA